MRYLTLFIGMTIGYIILGINIRAVSKAKLLATGITEFTYALIGFAMIRYVADAHTWFEALAYAAGATVGCLTSIHLTRHWT